jgi:hypothetical protein
LLNFIGDNGKEFFDTVIKGRLTIAKLVQPLGCGLDGREIRARFPAGTRDISVLRNVHTGTGAHPIFYPMNTEIKPPRREDDHSFSTTAEITNSVAISLIFHTPQWRGTYLIKPRDNITFTISS